MISYAFPVKTTEVRAFKAPRKAMGYFEEMIWQYHEGDEPCLFLPSLMELARKLGCSIVEIQVALVGLRKQGYDYFTMDIHSPVTVWYPSKMAPTH